MSKPSTNYVPVGISGGVETKLEPRLVTPPKVLNANNVSYRTVGTASRRYGTTALPALTGVGPLFIGSTNDELLVADRHNMYSYAPTTGYTYKGLYGRRAVETRPIVQQAVNQNYQYNQQGGVRCLSFDIVGDVGVAVWDTGCRYNVYNDCELGVVYVCCFNAATGKVYWLTSTTDAGMLPTPSASALYRLHGSGITANQPTGFTSTFGAAQPVVVAYRGKWVIGFIARGNAQTQGTVPTATTFTGPIYALVIIYLTPGVNGIPPQPTLTVGGANYGRVQSATVPIIYNHMPGVFGGTPNVQAQEIFDPINHYFDIATNGTDLCIVTQGLNITTAGTPWNSTTTMSMQTSADISALSFTIKSTTWPNIPSYDSAQAFPFPLTVAAATGNPYYFVAYQTGVQALAGATLGTGFGAPLQYSGSQYGFSNTTFGLYTWPAAAGIDGTSTSYTATVTNGQHLEQWTGNALTLTPLSTTTVSAPMTSLAQLPDATGGMSTVASRMYYTATSLNNSVNQPTCWLYALSPTPVTSTNTSGVGSFSNTLLVHLLEKELLARAHYLRTLPPRKGSTHPANVITYSGARWTAQMVMQNVADSIASIRMLGAGSTQQRAIVRLPQGALLVGGDTRYYDGLSTRSMGWQRLPELDHSYIIGSNSPPGNLVEGVEYTYYLVYVDYDAYGNAMYSSPSPPYSVTIAPGQNSARLEIVDMWPPLSPSATGTGSAIQIYRNAEDHPTLYYRVAVLPTSQYAGTQYWYDTTPEENSGEVLLYSPPSGGELPNDPPPPSTCAVASKSRVLVASSEMRTWVYPSKPFFPGRAPEFNAGQFLDIDPSSGPIVGMAVMDEAFIIFKPGHIYALDGPGPDATGQGAFNPTRNISTDTGLKDTYSIATTEHGVFFRSARGIQLLTRGGAVQYIGGPIEAYLTGHTITSAIVVPTQSQVRFARTDGLVLVYDYTAEAWTTFTYVPVGYTLPLTGTYMTYYNDTVYLAFNGTQTQLGAWAEGTPTVPVHADDTAVVPMTLTTAWTTVAGPQGWGRVRRISINGHCYSATVLTVQCFYDFDSAQFTAPVTYTLAPGAFNIRVRTTRQVCQSMCVALTDTPVSSVAGAGCSITGIVLETSPKSGATRLPDTASV